MGCSNHRALDFDAELSRDEVTVVPMAFVAILGRRVLLLASDRS